MCAQNPRLLSQRRFREWSEAGNRPWFIPADPKKYYANRDVWVSWEDFLGVRVGAGDLERVRPFKAYVEARKYMRALRRSGVGGRVTIVGDGGGKKKKKKHNRDDKNGKKNGIENWRNPRGDGDDNGFGAPPLEMAVPAPNTSSGYKVWASSGARPKDIPRNPVAVYGRRGEWVSWDDFLGRKKGEVKRRGSGRRGRSGEGDRGGGGGGGGNGKRRNEPRKNKNNKATPKTSGGPRSTSAARDRRRK